jgi:mRNA interferase MazF
LDPTLGHEQAGRRPVIVLSLGAYNEKVGLMLCCPVASRAKGYPFEFPLPDGAPVAGVTLADQIKSVDWRERRADFAFRLPESVTAEVLRRARAMLS